MPRQVKQHGFKIKGCRSNHLNIALIQVFSPDYGGYFACKELVVILTLHGGRF